MKKHDHRLEGQAAGGGVMRAIEQDRKTLAAQERLYDEDANRLWTGAALRDYMAEVEALRADAEKWRTHHCVGPIDSESLCLKANEEMRKQLVSWDEHYLALLDALGLPRTAKILPDELRALRAEVERLKRRPCGKHSGVFDESQNKYICENCGMDFPE